MDEIGYLPVTRTGAMLFFQLVTWRCEHASSAKSAGCRNNFRPNARKPRIGAMRNLFGHERSK